MEAAMSLDLTYNDLAIATGEPLLQSWFTNDKSFEATTQSTSLAEATDQPKSLSLKLGPTPIRIFSFTFPDAHTPSLRPSVPPSLPPRVSASPRETQPVPVTSTPK